MAKMFYTSEEAQEALGLDEEGLKQLTREGKLREFRDGSRIMYKSDQVDSLRGETGGDAVDLAGDSMGDSIGLADSAGASGSAIGLADTGDTGGGLGLSPDDTAADLGLSGSLGGVPSPSDTGSGSGITVLEDTGAGDPAAQTAISASVSDQINLEATGSGSGLLDLTREQDDTSLGADVLDDIGPGGTGLGGSVGGSMGGSFGGSGSNMGGTALGQAVPGQTMATPVPGQVPMAAAAAAYDPSSAAFAGLALGGIIASFIGLLAVAGLALRAVPGVLAPITTPGEAGDNALIYVLVGGLVLSVILAAIGFVIGKSSS
ncbi:MAG: helix-turn-helix domain-containing protein [Planctomycetota bacterium]